MWEQLLSSILVAITGGVLAFLGAVHSLICVVCAVMFSSFAVIVAYAIYLRARGNCATQGLNSTKDDLATTIDRRCAVDSGLGQGGPA